MKNIVYVIGSLVWMETCMAANTPDDFEMFQSVRQNQPHVTSLTFSGRPQLKSLDPLKYFPNLQSLHIERCGNVRHLIPIIGTLTGLKSLGLIEQNIPSLEYLKALKGLESLKLNYSLREVSIKPLSGLSKLQSLHIDGCPQARDWEVIGNLLELRDLNLSAALALVEEDFPGEPWRVSHYPPLDFLKPLRHLVALDLSYCFNIKSLNPLWTLTNLESLDLLGVDATANTDITEMKNLQKMRYLNVGYLIDNDKIQSVLKKLPCLEMIYCDLTGKRGGRADNFLKKSVNPSVITNPGIPIPKYNWKERRFVKC